MTSLRDRIEAVREVADTLMDTGAILRLSVEAMSDACERGVAVAFTRDKGTFTIMAEGEFITSGGRAMSHPGWIVDIDHVPAWQRDRRHCVRPAGGWLRMPGNGGAGDGRRGGAGS